MRISSCFLAVFFLFVLAPEWSFAQHNRLSYDRVMRDSGVNNNSSYNKYRKEFDHQQAEAPMLDVDEIVRRENAARARRQAPKKPVNHSSNIGCGYAGMMPCNSKGQAANGVNTVTDYMLPRNQRSRQGLPKNPYIPPPLNNSYRSR